MVNIFIANLDWSITSEDLRTTFATFGEVHYAHVVFEKETKRSRGYGYVEMEDATAAIAAIAALNGVEINGRAIDVKVASPKGNRPAKKEAPKPVKKILKKNPNYKAGPKNHHKNNANNNHYSQQKRNTYSNLYDNRENKQPSTSESQYQPTRVLRPRRKNMDENKSYEKVTISQPKKDNE